MWSLNEYYQLILHLLVSSPISIKIRMWRQCGGIMYPNTGMSSGDLNQNICFFSFELTSQKKTIRLGLNSMKIKEDTKPWKRESTKMRKHHFKIFIWGNFKGIFDHFRTSFKKLGQHEKVSFVSRLGLAFFLKNRGAVLGKNHQNHWVSRSHARECSNQHNVQTQKTCCYRILAPDGWC